MYLFTSQVTSTIENSCTIHACYCCRQFAEKKFAASAKVDDA